MYVIVMIKEKLQFLGYFGEEDQCTCTYITRIYTLGNYIWEKNTNWVKSMIDKLSASDTKLWTKVYYDMCINNSLLSNGIEIDPNEGSNILYIEVCCKV